MTNSNMRITLDTIDIYLLETMMHAAVTSMERYSTSATLVLCDPCTDKPVAEGTYHPYGRNGNSEPSWTVTSLKTGRGEHCPAITDTVAAFLEAAS